MPKSITSSRSILLLAEAFNCENNDAVRLLVSRAMDLVYGTDSSIAYNAKDLDSVVALIHGINPKDTVEVMLATQFVSLHLQSMTTMAKSYINAKGQGMMLMRLSHQALEMLQRYRGKGQTINVNYNTLIQQGVSKKTEDNS